jgi:PucR-like helix-turn-helix protein/diguanylate cyclase with GGDEF domain
MWMGEDTSAASGARAPIDLWHDDRPLPDWAREIATDFDVEALLEAVVPRCLAVAFPNHAHDEEFRERLHASCRANAYCLRSVIAGTISLDEVYLEQVLSFATVQAQLRIPQKSTQRSYRVSFFTMWEAWSGRLRAEIARRGIPCPEAVEAHQLLTQIILGYQDHVASQVAETYTRDYEALSRSRAHMRRSLVRDVLRGEDEGLSGSDLAILSYELSGRHLAVLLPSMAEGAATQLAVGLRGETASQWTLVYALTLGSTVIWLGRIAEWRPELVDAVERVLHTAGVPAALGEPQEGVDGFRTALTQAQDAELVRSAWAPEAAPLVVRYADVGLEILMMQNPALARAFVEKELGPLARDTAEAARLRETLEASFRFGSHVAAAEHLRLHEHTVRNRLQKAEHLLGHSLQERRTELQVATRMMRVMAP